MFWERLVFFIGLMTIAYIVSEASHSLVQKLANSKRWKFLVMPLVVIHWFSAIASLFVGLYMHFQKKEADELKRRIEQLASLSTDEVNENGPHLSEETYYYMEAANGMTVRVPESKLEEWTAQQEAISNGTAAPKLTEVKERLVDSIVRDLYGDHEDE